MRFFFLIILLTLVLSMGRVARMKYNKPKSQKLQEAESEQAAGWTCSRSPEWENMMEKMKN